MHNGWFCKGDGEGGKNVYWTPREIWDHYMSSVGIGWVNTLNAPPGTTGQIPSELVRNMGVFGTALKKLLKPVTASAKIEDVTVLCDGATAAELDFGSAATINAVITKEDLSQGQRVSAYSIDYFDENSGSWKSFDGIQNPYPFSIPAQQCGAEQDGVNLVSGAPPSTHVASLTDNATACAAICQSDPQCNTWTWHDETQGSYAKKCFVRYDTCYDYEKQGGHFSGVCNHTLPASQVDCGSTPPLGVGVHGMSVGAQLIDFVPETTTSKLRFRCTDSMGDGQAFIKSFSAHYGSAPEQ